MGSFDDIRENIRNRRMPMASTKMSLKQFRNRQSPTILIPTADDLKRDLLSGRLPRRIGREKAIAIGESKIWESWTDDQIVRFQLSHDELAIPFWRVHEAVTKVLGRPVLNYEFSSATTDDLLREYLKMRPAKSPGEILKGFRIGKED